MSALSERRALVSALIRGWHTMPEPYNRANGRDICAILRTAERVGLFD